MRPARSAERDAAQPEWRTDGLQQRRRFAGRARPIAHPGPQISGRLQQVSLSGEYTDFAVDLPGEAPWRPNDLVFSPEGEIVFTDPQNWEALSNADSAASYNGGQLLVASHTEGSGFSLK
jgi:hypothetical protein